MRWLALDVGSRRIGVAVCDADEQIASPVRAIAYTDPHGVADAVAALVRTWEAGGVVVGVPVTHSGQGRGEQRVAAVVAALQLKLVIPIETVDERGTTRAAEELLAAAGMPRRRWSARVDSVAARLILERYLATRPGSSAKRSSAER